MQSLFHVDPRVDLDDRGWYLSASRLDEVDAAADSQWPLRDSAVELLTVLNGVALLLRFGSNNNSLRLTFDFDGETPRLPSVRLYSVELHSWTAEGLSTEDADALVELAQQEPRIVRIFELIQHLDRQWVWFDLWKVWDVMLGNRNNRGAFKSWLGSINPHLEETFLRFENSANDPSLGTDRRHAFPQYTKPTTSSGDLLESMSEQQAVQFTKLVVALWIEKEFGVSVHPQRAPQ